MAANHALGVFDVPPDGTVTNHHSLTRCHLRDYTILANDSFLKEADIRIDSRVFEWGAQHPPSSWDPPPPDGWLQDIKLECTFKRELPEIADLIRLNPVLCLQAPTGTGKSTAIPGAVYEAIRLCRLAGTRTGLQRYQGLKVLHVFPTGEQVHQCYKHVFAEYIRCTGMASGAYSSALTLRGDDENVLSCGTNYLFATAFFGEHGLANGHLFDAIVIDEVHELSTTVMHMLALVRDKLVNKEVFRVVLLSATLSDAIRHKIEVFFQARNVPTLFTTLGVSPHSIVTVHENTDAYSSVGFGCANSARNYDRERVPSQGVNRAEQSPNMDELIARAVRMVMERLMPFEHARGIPPDPPGMLIFLPGAREVVSAKIKVYDRLRHVCQWLSNSNLVKTYSVTGSERTDIEALEASTAGVVRVCFTTPVLSVGVTLPGIDVVIDTGTRKLPWAYDRSGYRGLDTFWQDYNSREQRRGRVGRVRAGCVYPCYTRDAYNEMTNRDNTEQIVQSDFNTGVLAPLLSHTYDFIIPPEEDIINELVLEAGTFGAFRAYIDQDHYIPYDNPRVDAVGTAIGRCLKEVPLDLGIFLTYCSSCQCLFPGICLVATLLTRGAALKKPDKYQSGRNDAAYSLNAWPRLSGCSTISDMYVYADLVMNIFLSRTSTKRPDGHLNPRLPRYVTGRDEITRREPWVNKEGLDEFLVVVHALIAGCSAMRLCSKDNVLSFDKSGVHVENRGEFTYAHLHPSRLRRFYACILAALGHHVLKKAPVADQKGFGHVVYKLTGVRRGGRDKERLVQGERSSMANGELAVFHTIFEHSPDEDIATAHLHKCSVFDFLLYGNTHGATNDVLDYEKLTLLLYTNSGCFFFRFKDEATMNGYVRLRKFMKLLPTATLLGGYGEFIHSMRTQIDRMPNPQNYPVEDTVSPPMHAPIIQDIQYFIP